ncbi:hypothetical protein, partial [Marinobacter halodurans]|uniref:hypothetical protein n=1 Tax=Marinobacter halodurans TaxID=2528979 RepID=UPI001A955692
QAIGDPISRLLHQLSVTVAVIHSRQPRRSDLSRAAGAVIRHLSNGNGRTECIGTWNRTE